MSELADRAFALAADRRTSVVLGALLAGLALIGAGAGWDPLSSPAVLALAVVTALALLAGALRAGFEGRWGGALAGVGGALALGGLMLHVGSHPLGQVELTEGAAAETWVAASPAAGRRHLGRWLEELRWEPAQRRGSLLVRDPAGPKRTVPLAPGRPFEVAGLSLVPVAHGAGARPAGARLAWHERATGRRGEVKVRVGGEVPVGGGALVLHAARTDFNDQGPAVEVETRLGEAADRRWVFLTAPDHDERARSGPVAVAVRGLDPTARVRLAVDPRGRAWLPWLGLLLVAVGALRLGSQGVERDTPPRTRGRRQ